MKHKLKTKKLVNFEEYGCCFEVREKEGKEDCGKMVKVTSKELRELTSGKDIISESTRNAPRLFITKVKFSNK